MPSLFPGLRAAGCPQRQTLAVRRHRRCWKPAALRKTRAASHRRTEPPAAHLHLQTFHGDSPLWTQKLLDIARSLGMDLTLANLDQIFSRWFWTIKIHLSFDECSTRMFKYVLQGSDGLIYRFARVYWYVFEWVNVASQNVTLIAGWDQELTVTLAFCVGQLWQIISNPFVCWVIGRMLQLGPIWMNSISIRECKIKSWNLSTPVRNHITLCGIIPQLFRVWHKQTKVFVPDLAQLIFSRALSEKCWDQKPRLSWGGDALTWRFHNRSGNQWVSHCWKMDVASGSVQVSPMPAPAEKEETRNWWCSSFAFFSTSKALYRRGLARYRLGDYAKARQWGSVHLQCKTVVLLLDTKLCKAELGTCEALIWKLPSRPLQSGSRLVGIEWIDEAPKKDDPFVRQWPCSKPWRFQASMLC